MSQRQIITDLLGIQGWEVEAGGIAVEGEEVVVKVRPVAGRGYRCSGCGEGYLFAYDHLPERRVRDFPVWGRCCYLRMRRARVNCAQCGVCAEKLEWLEEQQRQTLRYERYVAHLCDLLPVLDVAELEGLDKNTVYRLDRKWLERRQERRQLRPVRYLGIDEIAVKKGQRYASVFYDLERREVIGIVLGRKQRSVSGFFRRWGKAMCKQVVAICMDLWSAFLNSVRIHCKHAIVVFDKFHVYSYLSTAIDEVRRTEQNRANKEGKELIKGSRWLWLKRNLKRKQKQTLQHIMTLNENLQKAYLLTEDFQQFYASDDQPSAELFLEAWTQRCQESQLAPFKKLAKRLQRWRQGILAYFVHRITNGVSEGLNNKIKVLKRRSYGFRDHHYFFLKILNITGAFPPLSALDPQQ